VEVSRGLNLGFKDNSSLSYSGVGIISKSISGVGTGEGKVGGGDGGGRV